jgi:hypothetical protein
MDAGRNEEGFRSPCRFIPLLSFRQLACRFCKYHAWSENIHHISELVVTWSVEKLGLSAWRQSWDHLETVISPGERLHEVEAGQMIKEWDGEERGSIHLLVRRRSSWRSVRHGSNRKAEGNSADTCCWDQVQRQGKALPWGVKHFRRNRMNLTLYSRSEFGIRVTACIPHSILIISSAIQESRVNPGSQRDRAFKVRTGIREQNVQLFNSYEWYAFVSFDHHVSISFSFFSFQTSRYKQEVNCFAKSVESSHPCRSGGKLFLTVSLPFHFRTSSPEPPLRNHQNKEEKEKTINSIQFMRCFRRAESRWPHGVRQPRVSRSPAAGTLPQPSNHSFIDNWFPEWPDRMKHDFTHVSIRDDYNRDDAHDHSQAIDCPVRLRLASFISEWGLKRSSFPDANHSAPASLLNHWTRSS